MYGIDFLNFDSFQKLCLWWYFYHSSDLTGTFIANDKKSSTFAIELIREFF